MARSPKMRRQRRPCPADAGDTGVGKLITEPLVLSRRGVGVAQSVVERVASMGVGGSATATEGEASQVRMSWAMSWGWEARIAASAGEWDAFSRMARARRAAGGEEERARVNAGGGARGRIEVKF